MTDEQNIEKDDVEGQGMKAKEPAEVEGQGKSRFIRMSEDADASDDKATESQDEKSDEPEVEGQLGRMRGTEK